MDNPPYGKNIVNNERKYGTISGYKLYPFGRVTEEFVEQEHPRDNDGQFTDKGGEKSIDEKVSDKMTVHLDDDKKKLWNILQDKKKGLEKVKDIDYYVKSPELEKRHEDLKEEYSKQLDDYNSGLLTDEEYRKGGRILEKKEFVLNDERDIIRLSPEHDDISGIDMDSYEIIKEGEKIGRRLTDHQIRLKVKIDRAIKNTKSRIKDGAIKMMGVARPNDEMLLNYYNSRVRNEVDLNRLKNRLSKRLLEEEEVSIAIGDLVEIGSDGIAYTEHGGYKIPDDHPLHELSRLRAKNDDVIRKKDEAMGNMVERMHNDKTRKLTINNDELLKKYNDEYDMYKKLEQEIPEEEREFIRRFRDYKNIQDGEGTTRGSEHLAEELDDKTLRGNNEILTPFINSRQHMYVIDNDGLKVPKDHIDKLYDLIKKDQRNNLWGRNYRYSFEKNQTNYELIAGSGKSFTVADDDYTSGAHWDKNTSTIRFFNASISNPAYSFHHERSHQMLDAIEESIDNADENGSRHAKATAFKNFEKAVYKIDEEDAKQHIGDYFASFVRAHKRGIGGYARNIVTEAFANITDLRYGKRKANEGYLTMEELYPEVIKNYEILYGEGEFYDYGEAYSSESVSEKESTEIEHEKISYLDYNYNFVDKIGSKIIVYAGYNNNYKLVSKKSYYMVEKSTEGFIEDEHPRDEGGQFTDKGDGRGKINDFKNKLRDRVKPDKTIHKIQREVDKEITDNIWKAIDELGVRDKVKDVAMQGSFEKGTDLPTSGSDLDLFIVFNTNVPEDVREKLGVEIGMKSLEGKEPYIQDATTKYAEAYFDYKGQKMEVQIVPTRHLTLQQIRDKELDGKPINIGMERTPHQTKFMKKALRGKEGEVRMLKQFMKDTGLYDSSMKSQGFSGYSSEVLIHNFDTFENVLKFFADFKTGSIVGDGEGNDKNIFSLIDPIDPNRDLISAFSPVKIGRTIKVAQHFLEHGEPPVQSKPVEMDSVSVGWDTTQFNEDTLVGQVRRTQKSIVNQLSRMGFNIPSKEEKITDDFTVDVPRTSMDHDVGTSKVKMTFGSDNLEIPETYKDKGVPLTIPKAVASYREANKGIEFVEEDGRLKGIKKRKFTHLADALKYLTTDPNSDVQKTSVLTDMQNGAQTSIGKSKFENLI